MSARRPKKGFLLVEAQREQVSDDAVDSELAKRLLPFVKPHRRLFAFAFGLMPLAALAGLVQPLLVKHAVDAVVVERSMDALSYVVVAYAIAVIAEFGLRFAQTYTMQLAGQRATASLRLHVFEHIQRLRVGYFDRTPIGRVVTRVTNDIDGLQEVFASGAVTAIADGLVLVGIVVFMFALDAELAAVTMLALPPLALIVNAFRKQARKAYRAIRVHTAALNAYLNEQVQGLGVVQAYGRERECLAEYEDINASYRRSNYASIRFDALLYSVVESVAVASIAIVVFYAAREASLIRDPAIAAGYVGTVVAFYDYIQRFFIPVRDLSTKYTVIQAALASCERIFGLLDVDEPDAPHREAMAANIPEDVAIRFEDVRFAYRAGHDVLHGISFDVKRGERVAIVGATGSGKSTLTALLLRLYEHDAGLVAVDGRDVRAFERHALRRRFAVVPQDVFLFRGTVLENVALEEAPDADRALAALHQVGALDLVERRGGLSARVEDRGQNFSAGERQLLALARALYADAPYLVLDEATANVDSELEARIAEATEEVLRGRTSIVIAHRLSTVRDADRIVVIHKGRLVEQGDHLSLLARDGVYARLHKLQHAGAAE